MHAQACHHGSSRRYLMTPFLHFYVHREHRPSYKVDCVMMLTNRSCRAKEASTVCGIALFVISTWLKERGVLTDVQGKSRAAAAESWESSAERASVRHSTSTRHDSSGLQPDLKFLTPAGLVSHLSPTAVFVATLMKRTYDMCWLVHRRELDCAPLEFRSRSTHIW